MTCSHPRELELLPVVKFTYDFLCLDCGLLCEVPWTTELAALSYDDSVAAAREIATRELATMEETDEPPERRG